MGIDVSKYKHNGFIATEGGVRVSEFVFQNNQEGFQAFLKQLLALDPNQEIRIGLESTGHYGINLKQFIVASGYTYLEFNPYRTHQFSQAMSLRRTKTDKVDARVISNLLGIVDYKTLQSSFYHINELKQLVRDRDDIMTNRSKALVRLTNLIDIAFPEYKPFFRNHWGVTALFILKKYHSSVRIAKLTTRDFEQIKAKSKGWITYPRFNNLRSLAANTVGVRSEIYDQRIERLILDYEYFDAALQEIETKIKHLFDQAPSKLLSLPRIGPVMAATIYAEIEDIHRFSTPSKLIAYAGFDVSIYQSGTEEHHGKMVKHGPPLLRKALWLYAFQALKSIPEFHDYYLLKKQQGKVHQVALAAVCRKLIRIIHHIETNHESFDALAIKQ